MKNVTALAKGVIVTGNKELDKALQALEPALARKLSRKTTRRIAKDIVLPAARDLAPVDSGDLEESLTVRAIKRSRLRMGHYVTCGETIERDQHYYSGYLEFGTKPRVHTANNKYVGFVAPHKFAYLRPAVYNNVTHARAAYIADMKEFVREAAK